MCRFWSRRLGIPRIEGVRACRHLTEKVLPEESTRFLTLLICMALQEAEDRVASDGKTIDFKVKDIA